MKKTFLRDLLLVVPAPTLGLLAGMWWWPGTALGQGLFLLAKVWVVAVPLLLLVAQRPAGQSVVVHLLGLEAPWRTGWRGTGPGLATGVVPGGGILAVGLALHPVLLDGPALERSVTASGLGTLPAFLAAGAVWSLANAFMEEWLWRRFVRERTEVLAGPVWGGVLGAMAFTLHHVFALAVYAPPLGVALGSAGVFLAGLVWNLMARRWGLWSAFVSHILADVGIFAVGTVVLFA